MKCIFCDIVNRNSTAVVVHETGNILSFLDIRPVNEGHTLVIPKIHAENFLELPSGIIPELFTTAQFVAKGIKDALSADGFNIVANNGIAAGQTVFHFHLHIIPRYEEDDFRFRPRFKKYPEGGAREMGEKIKKFL